MTDETKKAHGGHKTAPVGQTAHTQRQEGGVKTLTTHHTRDTLRRQLLSNGYTPLASRGKQCKIRGWPEILITEDVLDDWANSQAKTTTCVRLDNGLCAIDFDINHPAADDVIEAVIDALPRTLQPFRLERRGKGFKVAWFCRADTPFDDMKTARWRSPDAASDSDDTHMVEIFAGNTPRYFGAFGPHTLNEDGSTKIEYTWPGESLSEVPLHDLPTITEDQAVLIIDTAEAALEAKRFTRVTNTVAGKTVSETIYNLTDDMVFDLEIGGSATLADLPSMLRHNDSLRCTASWHDPSAKNPTRCVISMTKGGNISIHDFDTSKTHMPESADPASAEDLGAKIRGLAPRLTELAEIAGVAIPTEGAPHEVADTLAAALAELDNATTSATRGVRPDWETLQLHSADSPDMRVAKLLRSYAFKGGKGGHVVPLWPSEGTEPMTMEGFKTYVKPYRWFVEGPRGADKEVNPATVWESSAHRVTVDIMAMRPDMPRPTFRPSEGSDGGKLHLNTYNPVQHGSAAGGSVRGGVKLMKQLLPDRRERKWFMQWLSFKWQNPHVPGPAVIMVAQDTQGTGRGTFESLLKILFGTQYVREIGFNTFSGQSGQSEFDDWAYGSLIAVVNESSAVQGKGSYGTKKDIYERLKNLVQPGANYRTYQLKGKTSRTAMSFMSSLLMTNNPDAIPLVKGDRRFTVLTNGEPRDTDFWFEIRSWMENPANIAAFVGLLEGLSLAGYNPYDDEPLDTQAKADMILSNKSELDILYEQTMDNMGAPFTPYQFERKLRTAGHELGVDINQDSVAMVKNKLKCKKGCAFLRLPGDTNYLKFQKGTGTAKFRVDVYIPKGFDVSTLPPTTVALRSHIEAENGPITPNEIAGSHPALVALQGGKK